MSLTVERINGPRCDVSAPLRTTKCGRVACSESETSQVDVVLGSKLRIEAALSRVVHDANHLIARRPGGHDLAERALAGEVAPHELLAEDQFLIRSRACFSERAAFNEAHPHRLKILTRDKAQRHRFGAWRGRKVPEIEVEGARAGDRQDVGGGNSLDGRIGAQPGQDILVNARRIKGVAEGRDELKCRDVASVVPRIDVHQADEAAHEQPGPDTQHDRQRDLRDDHQCGRATGRAPRRADREDNPEDHRRCDRGRQYRCRDGDLTRAWHIRGDDEHDELNHPVGECGARCAARR